MRWCPNSKLVLYAEPDFLKACKGLFSVETVPVEELDEVFNCIDVDVLRLRKL